MTPDFRALLVSARETYVAKRDEIVHESFRQNRYIDIGLFMECQAAIESIDRELSGVTPLKPQPSRDAAAKRKQTRPAIGPEIDVYGRVSRLCGEYPTHSTLIGGEFHGRLPDITPFSEMEPVPGLGWLIKNRAEGSRWRR